MGSPLVRAAFGLLIAATVAAFVVTSRLKDELPLVLRFATSPQYFSPNGDGVRDRTLVGFDLTERAKVSFEVIDDGGNVVRKLVDDRELPGDVKHRFTWDGKDDDGKRAPEGYYRLRVIRRDEGRVIDSIKKLKLDVTPPRVALASVRPSVVAAAAPGRSPRVTIRYRGPRNEHPEYRIFRTDDGAPRVVLRFRGGDNRTAAWSGTIRGRPAAAGDYAFTVSVRDLAGNIAVAPAELPSPRTARPGTGVSVRRLTLQGPMGVVNAGAYANLTLGPVDRSFDFALFRLGSVKPVKRGERLGGRFRVRLPENARTGIYFVRVRAGDSRAAWPLAVAGLPPRGRAGRGPRPLVVLPAITSQGLNPVDDDADGFADTLENSPRVPLERPLVDGAALPRFNSQVLPLLRFLDRERIAFDLTTDAALAEGEGPALGNAPGVAFAGSARWLPPKLLERLRTYVRAGGGLATFGADAFRREVTLRGGVLLDPSPKHAEDAFGERTTLQTARSAPLAVEEDDLRLFTGIDDLFGSFSLFERSDGLAPGARPLSTAVRDPGKPMFIAYRLGKGTVIRSGTPDWAGELNESRLDLEVPRVTTRIISLLSSGG